VVTLFGSEKKLEEQHFNKSLAAQAEDSDSRVAMAMNSPSDVAYDPQVSALLLDVQRRFLKWKIVVVKNGNGESEFKWVCLEKFNYKEPYGDEPLSFMEEDKERKLLNEFDDCLSLIYQFGEKYNVDMSLAFNQIVNVRQSFLLNSRTTGRASRLAKSQLIESSARITREQMMPQKKKGFLGGILG